MTKLNIKAIVFAISVAFSAGAMAQTMSKSDYAASKDKISAEYKSAKTGCASLSGNANDICIAEAKGKEKIALADLEAVYKPTSKTKYRALVAKAEADYAVANERCDDLSGNAKDVCVKEAKSAKIAAKADAKAQMKISNSNAKANEKTAEARGTANTQNAETRKDAAADKLDGQYSVAKEKCDTYAGAAKDQCLMEAKARYVK